MAHQMDVVALKQKLAALRQTNTNCGSDADTQEARSTYKMLVAIESTACGATKRDAVSALAAFRELQEVYGSVGVKLHEAEQLLGAMLITPGKHEQIETALLGDSIKLASAQLSAQVRQLLTQRDLSGMSPERFLAVYSTAISNLTGWLNQCDEAADGLDAAIAHANEEAARLETAAHALNVDVPTELTVARASAQELSSRSKNDPLGAFTAVASEVTPLLDLVNRRLQAASIKKDHAWVELAKSLDGFRQTAIHRPGTESEQAAAAYAAAQKSLEAKTNLQEAEGLIAAYAMVMFN